jgi:6-pyruvoyltetrahydropterin/6-carboxytetrahydropterin synthase
MYEIVKSISFCYGHRLINYQGPCMHLHGHNAQAHIKLRSDSLDHRGMVVDFGELKRDVKRWIDEHLDHTMLLAAGDPIIDLLESAGEKYTVMPDNPTAENIARLIFDYVAGRQYPVVSVTLWETETCYAEYAP